MILETATPFVWFGKETATPFHMRRQRLQIMLETATPSYLRLRCINISCNIIPIGCYFGSLRYSGSLNFTPWAIIVMRRNLWRKRSGLLSDIILNAQLRRKCVPGIFFYKKTLIRNWGLKSCVFFYHEHLAKIRKILFIQPLYKDKHT